VNDTACINGEEEQWCALFALPLQPAPTGGAATRRPERPGPQAMPTGCGGLGDAGDPQRAEQ